MMARREKLRLQAAQMFEQDAGPVQVARLLRVSTKSAYQWRRRWRAGGPAALASRGAGGAVCRLDEQQLARLRAALDAGPAVSGWDEDQRWTLAPADALIARPACRLDPAGVDILTLRTPTSLTRWVWRLQAPDVNNGPPARCDPGS
jgi:transposase